MNREVFLNRIAERLGRARRTQPPARAATGVQGLPERAPLAPSLAVHFARELEAVGGRVVFADSSDHAQELLHAELMALPRARAITWGRNELVSWKLDRIYAELGARAVGDPGLQNAAEVQAALLQADVGITTAEAAVASTGSLVVSAAPSRPRAVSLLPSLHVALLREEQIVARLGDALGPLAARPLLALPSAVHFITGPSRTSDIENDLTIGVHGPANVLVILLRRGEPGPTGARH